MLRVRRRGVCWIAERRRTPGHGVADVVGSVEPGGVGVGVVVGVLVGAGELDGSAALGS